MRVLTGSKGGDMGHKTFDLFDSAFMTSVDNS